MSCNVLNIGVCILITIYNSLPRRTDSPRQISTPLDEKFISTHCGRDTHKCFNKLTIIGSDYGLLSGWCQAIIWTNAGILLIRTLGILRKIDVLSSFFLENVICENIGHFVSAAMC